MDNMDNKCVKSLNEIRRQLANIIGQMRAAEQVGSFPHPRDVAEILEGIDLMIVKVLEEK